MNADLFGGGLDEGFFFRGQAVERIHQLVYLPLQRACVRLGFPLFRREDARSTGFGFRSGVRKLAGMRQLTAVEWSDV